MTEKLTPILTQSVDRRKLIREKVLEGLEESFPIKSRSKTLDIRDLTVDEKDFSPTEQKQAILRGDTLFETVRGTVRMRDKDGKLVDEAKNFTVARLPWFTPRSTVIVAGNEYSIANQVRPKPGIYSRKRANGVLETSFNTKGGANFNVTMDTEKGEPQMEYGTSKIPLYPILREAGISHDRIEKSWGAKLARENAKRLMSKKQKAVEKLYGKVVPEYHRHADATEADQIKEIFSRYSNAQMDPDVNERTLGKRYSAVTPDSILDASHKLLKIYRNTAEVDDRDNLDFKALHSPDDFFKEVIKLNAREVARKAAIKMEATPVLKKALPPGPFTPGMLRFINGSQLVSVPTAVNPVELIDSSVRVTALGEGGIKSERAIPDEARHVHVTQIGALDPFRTPESFRAGVDIRAAMAVKKDAKGNIFVPVKDLKNGGKFKYVRAGEMQKSVVAFPGQELKGTIDGLQDGKIRRLPASKVRYQLPHPSLMYSPTTNLVPFIESLQGNRAVMGSKMQTQALSLVDREEPYVQVNSPDGNTYEHHMASLINPQATVSGTVAKIDGDYVYIRPDGEKTAARGSKLVKIPYEQNFPLAAKTHLDHELNVKVGDSVKKNQQLGESNFTRNGKLALGKNLSVAYMPYRGANSNDAVVISAGAAKKLTSERMYKFVLPVDTDMTLNKSKHKVYYGQNHEKAQYSALDSDGIIKPGTRITPGDPIMLGLRKATMTADDVLLGKLHKSLAKPYRESNQDWDHDHAGEVVDVVKTPKRIAITVKTKEPMGIGDKLCYTEDTEILTSNGWIPVSKVTASTTCYTVNPEGTIELHTPTALHHYESADSLYVLESQQVNLRVTPNHNLYVKRRGATSFKLLKASAVIGKRVRHKKDGTWHKPTPATFTIPEVKRKACGRKPKTLEPIDTLAWCRFLGAYLANGSYVIVQRKTRSNSLEYRLQLHTIDGQTHSVSNDQYAWIGDLIDACGLHANAKADRYIVNSRQLVEYVEQFGHAGDKYVPSIVFSWGADAAHAILEGLMGCDGSRSKSNSFSYSTTSKQLADDVQRLCLHAGWAANIKVKVPDNPNWNTCYSVRIVKTKLEPQINHGHSTTQSGQTESIVKSNEPVWGVTVPNHTLYTRVKGTTVWSGNSGRYGNKGVVSEVVPDDQMVLDEKGRPIDVIMTSAGVVSRTNPAVIIETAVGKVVEKTGKPIAVDNLTGRDNVKWAKELLKKHRIKDKETVLDPITGKKIPNVFVGRQYIMKLMKSTDTNYSARGLGSYDVNQQPTKGGVLSSKALGKMEFDALIGHNARNVLRESSTLKSQKNDEYWKALQLGYPTPPPKTAFAADKFLNMLTGAGVRVHREGTRLSLAPLTDAAVQEMSAGEIKDAKLVRAKDLKPETGGLFDPALTGGLAGKKWSHVSLAEPIVNPIFREPVRRLLGMTNPQLDEALKEKGGEHIRRELAKIDPEKKEKEIAKGMKSKSASNLNNDVKQIKYLRALRAQGLTPDKAYVVSKVPVLPPVFRPILPGRGGQEIIYGDVNPLYRDLVYTNNQFKDVKKSRLLPAEEKRMRPALNAAVGAVYGVNEPVSAKSRARGHKGFLTYISGTNSPKTGYFHEKLLKRTQDVAGRGTIVPDSTLGMDEVGLPEEMMWTMYEKFIVKKLVQNGYPALEASKMVQKRHPAAKQMLDREVKERPVMINRAPTLHRYNVVGAYPRMVPGKTIRVNPFVEVATNSDYDGDCLHAVIQVYTEKGIKSSDFNKLNIKPSGATEVVDYGVDSMVEPGNYNVHIRDFPRITSEVKVKGNKETYKVPEGIKVFGFSEKHQDIRLCDVTAFSVHHDLQMLLVVTSSGRTVRVSKDESLFGFNPVTCQMERFSAVDHPDWAMQRAAKAKTPPAQLVTIKSLPLAPKDTTGEIKRAQYLDGGFGWLLGAYIGVGTLFEHSRGALNKHLPDFFTAAPRDFLLGLLGGLLDTDGTVSIVQAKTKKKPQVMVHYTTISPRLADEIAALGLLLGIKTRVHTDKRKTVTGNIVYQVHFSTPDIAKIATEIPCEVLYKKENLSKLANWDFSNAAIASTTDKIPVPSQFLPALNKLVGPTSKARWKNMTDAEVVPLKKRESVKVILSKAKRTGTVGRSTFNHLLEEHGYDTLCAITSSKWVDLMRNTSVIWDFITDVTPIEGKHTAWDLTVPDGNTFMTANHLIVFDTMMIHAPIGNKAVDEVKQMTLSNMLYSDKSRNDLLVFPQHEAIMGLANASELDDKNQKAKEFKNEGDAMKAYRDGKIGLGTRVKIGKR